MNRNQIELARHARVTALVAQQYPDAPPDLQARIVSEYIAAELAMEERDYAEAERAVEAWATGQDFPHGVLH